MFFSCFSVRENKISSSEELVNVNLRNCSFCVFKCSQFWDFVFSLFIFFCLVFPATTQQKQQIYDSILVIKMLRHFAHFIPFLQGR